MCHYSTAATPCQIGSDPGIIPDPRDPVEAFHVDRLPLERNDDHVEQDHERDPRHDGGEEENDRQQDQHQISGADEPEHGHGGAEVRREEDLVRPRGMAEMEQKRQRRDQQKRERGQERQRMHRPVSTSTTPSSVEKVAPTGQTCTQGG